ncbi:hypothetical protein DPEC_G00117350 [Dallia pectoralis]|uniref:Uncharacterized protein n=1 Tax=Dallia pectoralis TaxID=75939 RepID=A0ACC2GUF4_DALPE|nr:hypothetical protein DPEC_G00117350 [Dallia pectoralis]
MWLDIDSEEQDGTNTHILVSCQPTWLFEHADLSENGDENFGLWSTIWGPTVCTRSWFLCSATTKAPLSGAEDKRERNFELGVCLSQEEVRLTGLREKHDISTPLHSTHAMPD